ncbi:hypothetical protein HMF7854_14950 [Sphingomonas ginkgonis]|uniref:N-acetyltransferase domain-containing protein n=1 Tax=Sphingomonas ginkgonis TaxID=2315330 RepID=A0A3R9Z805_9SPHN|nr:hypothetical protein [Sphingomonas ginkgonis]RST31993.1 hypothetical protein HMF7854_14950 [Sphingomonas ginkgonis]
MQQQVRVARQEDVPFLAWVMYESMVPSTGKGIFDEALEGTGTTPLEFHQALLRSGSNNWSSLDSFLVLDDDEGRPAGAMGAFDGTIEDLRPLTAAGLERVAAELGWSSDVTRAFWRRYISFFGLFGKSPQLLHAASYVLEFSAIRSDLRGKGIYGRFLEGHRERARALGHDAMSASAVFGNEAVIRAITRFGFKEARRIGPEAYRNRFPGMIRYRYEID